MRPRRTAAAGEVRRKRRERTTRVSLSCDLQSKSVPRIGLARGGPRRKGKKKPLTLFLLGEETDVNGLTKRIFPRVRNGGDGFLEEKTPAISAALLHAARQHQRGTVSCPSSADCRPSAFTRSPRPYLKDKA
jgi:hypothetical protein